MNKKVQTFLETPSDLPKIIVIYGPTASGKTAMSISIAKELDTEVISADSRQIYRGMDIGTAKITEEEKEGIIHHMIDIKNIDEQYSVGEYTKEVREIISRLHAQWKVPIICGGTGLYIDSLIYDFDIPEVEADWDRRKKLEDLRLKYGNQYIWDILHEIDPDYANELHPNNYRYVMRGIEVFEQTGASKKQLKTTKQKQYDTLLLMPDIPSREWLYERINRRVDIMMEQGLAQEVQNLLRTYGKNAPGFCTIGYTEVIEYLEEKCSLEECGEKIKQHSRNYAKRQLTWFNKYAKE